MQRQVLLFLCLALVFGHVSGAFAAPVDPIIDDHFLNSNLVDLNLSSNISVNPDPPGTVTLKEINRANALMLFENRYDVGVLTPTGVRYFSFTGTSLVENAALSYTQSDLLGVAPGADYDYAVLDATSMKWLFYDGSGMVQNPILSVLGLTNPVSLAVGDEVTWVADQTSIKGYVFDGSGMSALPVAPPGTGVVAPGMSGFDVVVLDKTNQRVRYYSYDGASLIENPLLSITGFTNAKALAVNQDSGDIVVLDGNNVRYFQFTGSGMAESIVLSIAGLSDPVTIAVKPGFYEYAVVRASGAVDYYQFDGTGMQRNPALSLSGLGSLGGYKSPGQLVSTVVNHPNVVGQVTLTLTATIPPGTAVSAEVSTDGGSTYVPVTPGVKTNVPSGQAIRYRLTLTGGSDTPIIDRVFLDNSTLMVSASLEKNPVAAGAEFVVNATSLGWANRAELIMPDSTVVPMTAVAGAGQYTTSWRAASYMDALTPDGDYPLIVRVYRDSDGAVAETIVSLQIQQSILEQLRIRLVG